MLFGLKTWRGRTRDQTTTERVNTGENSPANNTA